MTKLIAHEVKELSRLVSDTTAIAKYINRVHGTDFDATDIELFQQGRAPIERRPVQVRLTKLIGDALPVSPPLTTLNDNGVDPLAKALAAYHAKRTNGDLRAYWQRLAA